MAKDKRDHPIGDAKRKMTFVMFQLEGSDETLQQGFKAIEQAFQQIGAGNGARTYGPAPAVRQQISADISSQQTLSEETEAVLPVAHADESSTGQDEVRGRQQKPRKYTSPKFLDSLDLASGDVSFKQYAQQKKPSSDNAKYLVVSRWFDKFQKKDTITTNELYTCFQAMGWKSQNDVSQPFRLLKMRKSYFEKVGDGWKITHVGRDAADAIGTERGNAD